MAVALATEDELSEAVGIKLLSEHPVLSETPPLLLRKNGSGYLRSRMSSWRQMANQRIVVVLTDLDRVACPVMLLEDWLGAGFKPTQNSLLRIAVREVESWLLADHDALRKLFGTRDRFPVQPDSLPDPKQHLLGLSQRAPRTVRDDLVAQRGAVSRQGIGYNRHMVGWVETQWCPQRAEARSPSLARARRALSQAAVRVAQDVRIS